MRNDLEFWSKPLEGWSGFGGTAGVRALLESACGHSHGDTQLTGGYMNPGLKGALWAGWSQGQLSQGRG
jgi:hypothetical protein